MKEKKDSAYFKALGTAGAQGHMAGGKMADPFFRDQTSWQAKAYWQGYDEHMTEQPPVTVNEQALNVDAEVPPCEDVAGRSSLAGSFEQLRADARPDGVDALAYTIAPRGHGKSYLNDDIARLRHTLMSDHLPPTINLDGWPKAPQAHYIDLKRMAYLEREPKRLERLIVAMARMVERWEVKA